MIRIGRVGAYWITGGAESEELFASLRLGDNQHRRNYEVYLRQLLSDSPRLVTGKSFKVQLRVDGIERPSEQRGYLGWNIKAIALCVGRIVKVRGYINFHANEVSGDLQTVPRKKCGKCSINKHTIENRCKECGELLELIEMPTLQ